MWKFILHGVTPLHFSFCLPFIFLNAYSSLHFSRGHHFRIVLLILLIIAWENHVKHEFGCPMSENILYNIADG
jgi:hypothetical protein